MPPLLFASSLSFLFRFVSWRAWLWLCACSLAPNIVKDLWGFRFPANLHVGSVLPGARVTRIDRDVRVFLAFDAQQACDNPAQLEAKEKADKESKAAAGKDKDKKGGKEKEKEKEKDATAASGGVLTMACAHVSAVSNEHVHNLHKVRWRWRARSLPCRVHARALKLFPHQRNRLARTVWLHHSCVINSRSDCFALPACV